MPANNLTKITLTEDDIAGGSLRIKTANNLTIPKLKRWLSRRKRSKIMQRETDLIER